MHLESGNVILILSERDSALIKGRQSWNIDLFISKKNIVIYYATKLWSPMIQLSRFQRIRNN